jgi:mannosyltransferase
VTGLGAKIEGNLPATQPAWYEKGALFALLAMTILRLWIPPLSSSLWVDETGTFWMASGSLAQTISRCLHWPGQSPLYGAIVWAAMKIGGQSEVAMRLPSVAAMALTAFLLYRLGVRILDRQAALLATLVFVALHDVAFAAADARPYSCALLAAVASTLLLVRWLEGRRFADWFGYVLLSALVVHLHYFFSLIFAVHAIYAIAWHRTRGPVNWLWLVAAAAVIGVLVLPLAGHLRLLGASRSSISYRDTPDPLKLFQAITPPAVACGLAAGLLLAYLFSEGFALRSLETNPSSLALIVSWLAVAPVLLFAVSFLTPTKIFVPRYYFKRFSWAGPAHRMGDSRVPSRARALNHRICGDAGFDSGIRPPSALALSAFT